MALVECWECKTEISAKAERCPKCGAKPKQTRLWPLLVIGVVLVPYLVSIQAEEQTSPATTTPSAVPVVTTSTGPEYRTAMLREKLVSEHLEITVNSADVMDEVRTGNQFADLKSEPGNQYVVMDVTIKNVDRESRMLTDGVLWLSKEGTIDLVEFDHSENVLVEGWGLALKAINPMVTINSKVAFKIPKEFKGAVFWQPPRTSKKTLIGLGKL